MIALNACNSRSLPSFRSKRPCLREPGTPLKIESLEMEGPREDEPLVRSGRPAAAQDVLTGRPVDGTATLAPLKVRLLKLR